MTGNLLRIPTLAAFATAALISETFAAPAPDPVLPQRPATACERPLLNPGGAGVPLQVQVRDQFGAFPGTDVVTVSSLIGQPLASLSCSGPFLNFRVAPGTYRVLASNGAHASREVTVNVPDGGARVTVTLQSDVPPLPPSPLG